MPFVKDFFVESYFPSAGAPFGKLLTSIFFDPIADNRDYPIHGPNVIRFTRALVDGDLAEPGLINANQQQARETVRRFTNESHLLAEALEAQPELGLGPIEKARELLTVAALYHDIGKSIRRANHPQIGANLVRNFDEQQRRLLADGLFYPGEHGDSKNNRFSLISSITQHHDKFGVVSTGEGALPIFSDILYFSSSPDALGGIKKNVTAVMLVNLADIAAVNTAPAAVKEQVAQLASEVFIRRTGKLSTGTASGSTNTSIAGSTEEDLLRQIGAIIRQGDCCLGLTYQKMANVLTDWETLIKAIGSPEVSGDRVALKGMLLRIERNPARTIRRIVRLLHEASSIIQAPSLQPYMSPTAVESVLVGTLGAHQFQTFCEQFATVAKLDYGLNFFRSVMCACIRLRLKAELVESHPQWGMLTTNEQRDLEELDDKTKSVLTDEITILFVQVLESLVGRYVGVLDHSSARPRRFGFQMRDLTLDKEIRQSIIRLLCVENEKVPIALTWIADEVTIWSMD